MVRLKEAKRRGYVKGATVFQFQNGTIKSSNSIPFLLSVHLFQFQNGTIKSPIGFFIQTI